MDNSGLSQRIRSSLQREAMPIAMYPGLSLANARVKDVITNSQIQFDIQAALHARYHTKFVLSAMDLSAEAEAFGCEVHFSENEIPSIVGRRVTGIDEAKKLSIPKPGDGRTGVYLETVSKLRKISDVIVVGGCIGPFSLAARIVGVTEALELTASEPDLMHSVIEKCSIFLGEYLRAFKTAGAHGVLMAEPAAGLLSPRGLSIFSSNYIREITRSIECETFSVILHNCAAKNVHLPAILATGLHHFHFGAPMDIIKALSEVSSDIYLFGNLDPARVFCQTTRDEMKEKTNELLASTARFKNFVISSGCDLPPNCFLENLDGFFSAVEQYNSVYSIV